MRSSDNRSRTSTPARAASEVAMAITSGIARPSACGHEITSTVTVRVMASPTSPSSVHTTNVTAPAAVAR